MNDLSFAWVNRKGMYSNNKMVFSKGGGEGSYCTGEILVNYKFLDS